MSEERKNMVVEKREINKVRFDVYLMDSYADDDDWGKPMISNIGHIEAVVYLAECAHFGFKITEHGNPNNIFMSGHCHEDMRRHERGDASVVLGFATPEQSEQIYKILHEKD